MRSRCCLRFQSLEDPTMVVEIEYLERKKMGRSGFFSVNYSRRNSEDKPNCIGKIAKHLYTQASPWHSPFGSDQSRRFVRGIQGCTVVHLPVQSLSKLPKDKL